MTSSNSSTIFQIDQQIVTMNGDLPRDGDHPRDDDYPNDHPYPPDSNPYPPGYSVNHPGCPDHFYWLLIKVSSTYTQINIYFFDIMTTSAQRAAAVKILFPLFYCIGGQELGFPGSESSGQSENRKYLSWIFLKNS